MIYNFCLKFHSLSQESMHKPGEWETPDLQLAGCPGEAEARVLN